MKISPLCLLLLFFSSAKMQAQKTPSAIDSLLFGPQAIIKIPKHLQNHILPGDSSKAQDSLRLQSLSLDPFSFQTFDMFASDDFAEFRKQDAPHRMPIYSSNGKFEMPVQTIDSTKTYSLRIYSLKKNVQ